MNIQSKNILFISPEFFGVDKEIISNLRKLGANVIWFDERAVKSSFGRAVNSINPALFNCYSNRYYKSIIDTVSGDIDIILVIKGDMITPKTIDSFRNRWPKAELILYLYDPVINIHGIESKLSLYDRVISFEPKDCKKYGFEFRPLFSDFSNTEIERNNEFDICFYGTMYGDRFDIVYQVRELCEKKCMRFYSFCFLRGKFMALYYMVTNKGFRKLGLKSISFKPKSASELSNIVKKSKTILDANDINQQGLTIRTLETLLSGKKMITTNSDIANYDFYNPNNILIVSRDQISIPDSFFESDYETISEEVLSKYTATGWIKDVFKL